jgi:hypothetical protein
VNKEAADAKNSTSLGSANDSILKQDNPSKINVFYVAKYGAKLHTFDSLLRHYFFSFSFITPNALLTQTLKSD